MNQKILVVMPPNRRSELLRSFDGKCLQIFLASNVEEAARRLNGNVFYDLLLTDSELADGSWQDVLQMVVESTMPCEMIVCSRCADESLWADVLQSGAYDLLVEPYDPQEVNRIVENAIESQYMRRFAQMSSFAKVS